MELSEPLVSVVLPTRGDRPALLAEAIGSVEAQRHRRWELIVVNDGGPRTTASGESARLVRVDLPRRSGPAAARNAGLARARGAIIAYLDDDDLYHPDHLTVLAHALADGVEVAYTDAEHLALRREGSGWRSVGHEPAAGRDFDPRALLVGNFVPLICLAHTRRRLEAVGGFDERLPKLEDWELLLRLTRGVGVVHVPRTTAIYRHHQGLGHVNDPTRDLVETVATIYRLHPAPDAALAREREARLRALSQLACAARRQAPSARALLAQLSRALGESKLDRAEQAARALIAELPDDRELLAVLAKILRATGRAGEAARLLAARSEPTPSPAAGESFVFDQPHGSEINSARMDHLGSLGLELSARTVLEVGAGLGYLTSFFEERGCRVLSTDARRVNVDEHRRRAPARRVERADLSVPGSHERFGAFDVVFCYGTLYHLSDPALAIQELARACRHLLLLETCVWPEDNGQVNEVAEPGDALDQSIEGRGCRPARDWVLAELRKHFAHVYVSASQPDHPDFPLRWPVLHTDRNTRSIFVASREPIGSALLLDELPTEQSRAEPGAPVAGGGVGAAEGYLFGEHRVLVDPRAPSVGGSWQGERREGRPTAWDSDVIRFFFERTLEGERPVMLDVGANTGTFCLLPSLNPALTGYAFEPTPAIRTILARNIALNQLQDRMKVIPMAVSDRGGTQKLKLPRSGNASGLACLGKPLRFHEWDEIEVPVTTLDRFAFEHNLAKVDLIKIDTEGCELLVLRGGEALIREHRPGILTELFEQNTLQFGYHAQEIVDLLRSWGYQGERVGSEDMYFHCPRPRSFAQPRLS